MRQMTNTALRALFEQNSDEIFYKLLTITADEDGAVPVRVYASNETENGEPRVILHRGMEYVAVPFEINIPGEGEDVVNEVNIKIANVSQEITEEIRRNTKPFKVDMRVVLASELDSIQAGPWDMRLVDIKGDAIYIEGTIIADRFMDEPFPKDKMDASLFPQMF